MWDGRAPRHRRRDAGVTELQHEAKRRHFGEAERLVADAKAQISSLEGSVAHLREEREKAVASTRVMRDRLSAALEAHTSDGDGHQQGDGPYEGQHHQG
jgi:hypothetical protein